jgi:thymidine kinase
MAKLYFRYSSMGAGKSLDLLKVAYNYKERNKNVLIFTSDKDNRYEVGKVTSRIGIEEQAILFTERSNIFKKINTLEKKPDCILFDESQFLTEQQVKQITDIVDELNIPVICYGLRNDYKGNPFEGSCYLMALADTIEEIKTICHCGKKAIMNLRIKNGEPIYEGEQVSIGGNESYISVCRKHYKQGKVK